MRHGLVIVIGIAVCGTLLASDPRKAPRNLTAPAASETPEANEMKRELANRVIERRESPGREFPGAVRQSLLDELMRSSLEELRRQADEDLIAPMALGNTQADLLYTTVIACRVIDTRLSGGALAGGETRNFKVAGVAGFESQGGRSGGCRVPFGASAVHMNFVGVNPTGRGKLRADRYPSNNVGVGTNILNYQALTPPLNIANAVNQMICDPAFGTCTFDLAIRNNADASTTIHVVADVVGYFTRFPKEVVRSFVLSQDFGPVDVGSTCEAYGSVTLTPPVTGKIAAGATLGMITTHTAGSMDFATVALSTSPGVCSGRNGSETAHFTNTNAPTGEYYSYAALSSMFYVPPAVPVTIFINAIRTGATDQFDLNGFRITAQFFPD